MTKNRFDKQIPTNKTDKYIGLSGFFVVIGCVLAILIALTVRFIQWLFS